MNMQALNITQASLKTEWPQSLFLLALVFVFSFNSLGLLDFNTNIFPGFQLNLARLQSPVGGIQIPDTLTTLEFFFMFISGIVLSLGLPILTPIAASILVLILTLPPFILGVAAPFRNSDIPMQYSLLVLLVLFGVNVLLQYFTETRKKQKILDTFGRYVPPEIVNELSAQSSNINLDGESKRMTVMFCDLQDFSSVSELLSPTELLKMLNDYFSALTEILYKHGATIDKYIGDSIMTFWNAPLNQKDHARKSILASLDLQTEAQRLSNIYPSKGWPSLKMGVGVNTGIMNVGNMGSRYRLAYTVVGDSVNISSRLQEMTRVYKVPIICGEESVKDINDIEFLELDTIFVRGKSLHLKIFEPLGLKSETPVNIKEALKRHKEALEFYYAKEFERANEIFSVLEREFPKHKDYYTHMQKQLRRLVSLGTAV